MTATRNCLGALALELTPGTQATRGVLDLASATELTARVARDLAKIAPDAAQLDIGLLAGLFDPVELLRPRWPLHAQLQQWITQAPGQGEPRVIAFAGHEGRLPDELQPDPAFAGGALRLLPFVLSGEGDIAASVDSQLEESLLTIGMAGAETALLAQQHFGLNIEHARYLTLHDLAAMMALQYENVGLGALWPLIESALLSPGREQWLDAAPEPLIRLVDGQARIALLDDESWVSSGLAPANLQGDPIRLGVAFDYFQRRQRQIAALLEAHGIETTYDHCPVGRDARAILRA